MPMESIALLSISGHVYYIKNNFSFEQQCEIERIAKQIQSQIAIKECIDEKEVLQKFTSDVFQQLNLELELLSVSVVFRINM
jgi:hypothetical protein